MDRPAPPDPLAERFVHQLIGTGLALANSLETLIEPLEDDNPFPGEDPAKVVLDMAVGTIAIALRDVPDHEVERAIELMRSAHERYLADLRLAARVSRRRRRTRR